MLHRLPHQRVDEAVRPAAQLQSAHSVPGPGPRGRGRFRPRTAAAPDADRPGPRGQCDPSADAGRRRPSPTPSRYGAASGHACNGAASDWFCEPGRAAAVASNPGRRQQWRPAGAASDVCQRASAAADDPTGEPRCLCAAAAADVSGRAAASRRFGSGWTAFPGDGSTWAARGPSPSAGTRGHQASQPSRSASRDGSACSSWRTAASWKWGPSPSAVHAADGSTATDSRSWRPSSSRPRWADASAPNGDDGGWATCAQHARAGRALGAASAPRDELAGWLCAASASAADATAAAPTASTAIWDAGAGAFRRLRDGQPDAQHAASGSR